MTIKGAILAVSAFGFMATLAPQAMAGNEKDGAEIVCDGINACKGHGSCAGPGHACAGQNACKGQGHTKTTKKECLDKGGKVVESKDSKDKGQMK
jgi:uncharacterized membrane protein